MSEAVKVAIVGHGVFALANAYGFLRAGHEVALIGHSWLQGSSVHCFPICPNNFETLKASFLRRSSISYPEIFNQPLNTQRALWLFYKFKDALKHKGVGKMHHLEEAGGKVFLDWKSALAPDLDFTSGKAILSNKPLEGFEEDKRRLAPAFLEKFKFASFSQDRVWNYERFWSALYEVLKASPKVSFFQDTKVRKWNKKKDKILSVLLENREQVEADLFCLVGGCDMSRQIKKMKINLNVQPITSYSVEFSSDSLEVPLAYNFHLEDLLLFVNLVGDKIRISGFRDLIGWKEPMEKRRHFQLLKVAESLLNVRLQKHAQVEYNSAFYPSLGNGLPALGASSKYQNFFLSVPSSNLSPPGMCGLVGFFVTGFEEGNLRNLPFARRVKHFA